MDINIIKDDIFVEEFTIENVAGCKISDLAFQDVYGNDMSIDEVKSVLVQSIKNADMEQRESSRGTHRGRYEKGRFNEYNRSAEKYASVEADIYLLYWLCGNMQEVAGLLGVCRQTVSRKIKQYKMDNGL